MRQVAIQQNNDLDELEAINVSLEDNREDQIDELVQRSFRKIKRKEQTAGIHSSKGRIAALILLSLLLLAAFQYFVGFSSIKAQLGQTQHSRQQNALISQTPQNGIMNEDNSSKRIDSTLISNVNAEKKEEQKVSSKVNSTGPAHQLSFSQVKIIEPANKTQIKQEKTNKTKQPQKLAQGPHKQDKNKNEEKNKNKDSAVSVNSTKEIEKKDIKDTTKDNKKGDKTNSSKKTDEKNKTKEAIANIHIRNPTDNEKNEKTNKTHHDKKKSKTKQAKEETQKQLPTPDIQQDGFLIPRNLWTLSTRPNYFQILVAQNHLKFAQGSNFTRNIINKQNYGSYLSEERNQKLQIVFQILKQRMKDQKSNLESHFQQIQKKLILLSVLYENGGIIIDDTITVTESFDWIRKIKNNIYVNRGNLGFEPKVVGFYSPFYSSPLQKQNKKPSPGMEEVDKYMVLIPTIEGFFIAAQKKAEFIGKLLEQSIAILLTPNQVKTDIAEKKYNYIHVNDHDVYYHYFIIASQRVLLKRQSQLDSVSKDPSTRSFAIDSFGLNLINCYYGPNKTSIFFESFQPDKDQQNMQSIARIDMSQLQSTIGPLRYMTSTTVFKDINEYLSKIKKKNSKKHKGAIMKGSFLDKMYFSDANQSFIYENPYKQFVNQRGVLWKDLPKTIWIFWDKGLSNPSTVPAEVILCVQNLKRVAAASEFTVKQLNDTNLKDYLSQQKIDEIEQALDNLKNEKYYKQIRCDLYRLAILYQHGGVYMDTSIIAIENFDWLVKIARLPSKFIENRNGILPEVLMFWDPYFGNSVQWKTNDNYLTKTQWLLQYQNSFIAAIKESQFIKEWLSLFLDLAKQSVITIMQTFQKCKVPNHRQLDENSHSLLSINTAKCVLGRKQQLFKKQKKKWKGSMDFYGIWTINSFVGPFKFKAMNSLNDLDRNEDQFFLNRYPQQYIEGVIGKINFFVKLTVSQRNELVKFLKNNSTTLLEQSHSKSVFRQHLYNPPNPQAIKDTSIAKPA